MKDLRFLAMALLMFSITVGCNDDDNDDPDTLDYSQVLDNVTTQVIVDTYQELDNAAQQLWQEVQALSASPSGQQLEAAKAAWVASRAPWEKSEGFLFGPVDTEGIDPALDSWPVNKVDLENVLASGDNLTSDFVNSLEGTLKGFHTIEFLLWGGDGNKTVNDFTSREFEYLLAATEVLANDAGFLYTSWATSGDNFQENLLTAGEEGSIYISQKAALEELANGILGIADEVGNGKINDPLEQEDLSLEESQFSDNSKIDFTNNIRSIQNVYIGISGPGLTSVVIEIDSDLDARIREDIQSAIDAIQAIPGTFTEAIPASSPTRSDAEAAQAAVRTLQATLEEELIPLISNL